MTYSEAFREGFRLINKNWQLVAIQAGVMAINFITAILVVILPIVIAAISMGIDVSSFSSLEKVPFSAGEILARYFSLVLIGAFFLLLYLIIISVIAIFTYGGATGLIANAVRKPEDRFSLKLFFSEGKRLFFPLLSYFTVAGLFLIVAILLVALSIFASVSLVGFIKQINSTAGLFSGIFLFLFLFALVLFTVTSGLAITFYGTAVLIFKGKGSLDSLREAALFLYRKQNAYWLYCILIACSIGLAIILMLMGLPFNLIPILGPIIAFPYQIFSLIVQSYFGFFVMAVLFLFYYRTGGLSGVPAIDGTSTSAPLADN